MRRLLHLAGAALVSSLVIWTGVLHWMRQPQSGGQAVVRATVDLRALQESARVGDVVDAWRGVPVRVNGVPYHRSVGSHHAASGYYYGRQWQCVEYVKRYYHDAHGHWMPDVMGHAKSFYDPALPAGEMNPQRAMRQYPNGGTEPPRVDDLLVWNDGTFGHVAVICRVEEDFIEVVQQNVLRGSRERFAWEREAGGGFRIRGRPDPAGWLRLEGKSDPARSGSG